MAAHLRSFFEKLVHLRDCSYYTFARILFPGKRYDCAHCILLTAKLYTIAVYHTETTSELCYGEICQL